MTGGWETSLRAIAEGLNAAGIPAARGNGEWSAVQVQRFGEAVNDSLDLRRH